MKKSKKFFIKKIIGIFLVLYVGLFVESYFLWGYNNIVNDENYFQTAIKRSALHNYGAGKIIAILDTGINDDNSELRGKVIAEYDFTTNSPIAIDYDGHGTKIASIIAANNDGQGITGIAYNAKLIDTKIVDENGNIKTENIIKAIEFSVKHGANVINMSFSSGEYSQKLQDVINKYAKEGIIFVAAAGNDGDNKIVYPAGYNNVIAVGSLDRKTGKRAVYSNYGNWVDEWIEDGIWTYDGNKYKREFGTSEAAAVVSGYVNEYIGIKEKQAIKAKNIKAYYNISSDKDNNNSNNILGINFNQVNYLNLISNLSYYNKLANFAINTMLNKFLFLGLYYDSGLASSNICSEIKKSLTENEKKFILLKLFEIYLYNTNTQTQINNLLKYGKNLKILIEINSKLQEIINIAKVNKATTIIKRSESTAKALLPIIKSLQILKNKIVYESALKVGAKSILDSVGLYLGDYYRLIGQVNEQKAIIKNVEKNTERLKKIEKIGKFLSVGIGVIDVTSQFFKDLSNYNKEIRIRAFLSIKGAQFIGILKSLTEEAYINNKPSCIAKEFIEFIKKFPLTKEGIEKYLVPPNLDLSKTDWKIINFCYDSLSMLVESSVFGIALENLKTLFVENSENSEKLELYSTWKSLIFGLKEESVYFSDLNDISKVNSKDINLKIATNLLIMPFMENSMNYLKRLAKDSISLQGYKFYYYGYVSPEEAKIENGSLTATLDVLVNSPALGWRSIYNNTLGDIWGDASKRIDFNKYLQKKFNNSIDKLISEYNYILNILKNYRAYLLELSNYNFIIDEIYNDNNKNDIYLKWKKIKNTAEIIAKKNKLSKNEDIKVKLMSNLDHNYYYGYSLFNYKDIKKLSQPINRKDFFIMMLKAIKYNPYEDKDFIDKFFDAIFKNKKEFFFSDINSEQNDKTLTLNEKIWLTYGKYKKIIYGDNNKLLPFNIVNRATAMAIVGRIYKKFIDSKNFTEIASQKVNELNIIDYNQIQEKYPYFKKDIDICLAEGIIVGAGIDDGLRALLLDNNLTYNEAITIALRVDNGLYKEKVKRFLNSIGNLLDDYFSTFKEYIKNIFQSSTNSLPTIKGNELNKIIIKTILKKEVLNKFQFKWVMAGAQISKVEKSINEKGYIDFYIYVTPEWNEESYIIPLEVVVTNNSGESLSKSFYYEVVPYEISNQNNKPNLEISIQFSPQYLSNNQFKIKWKIKNAEGVRFEYSFDKKNWKEFTIVNLVYSNKTEETKVIDEAKNYNKIYFRADVKDKNDNHIYKLKELSYIPEKKYVEKATEIPAKTTIWGYQKGGTTSAEICWKKIIDSHYNLNVNYYELLYAKANTSDKIVLKFNDNSNPNNMYSENCRIINGLAEDTKYYFKVRGCNDLGCGEWSDAEFVTINIEHKPTFNTDYQYPKDGANNVSKFTDFRWSANDKDGDKLKFKVFWGESPDKLTYSNKGWTSNYFVELEKPLKPNTTYYWQVEVREDGHWKDYYGGEYIKSPIWHFTTANKGYDLIITDAKLISNLKPDSNVTFKLTIKNIGSEKAIDAYIQAYYKKGDKISEFRIGSGRIGKELSPGESTTVDITVKFQDYIIKPNQYNGNKEYDNILVTGDSYVIFDMPYVKYDGQDINLANNKKEIKIYYENKGAPKFEYFDVRFNGFSFLHPSDSYKDREFYGITGKELQIVADVVDDVRCDRAKIEYKTDEDEQWHLIKEFKDNKYEHMHFIWIDENGKKVDAQNFYNWIIPEDLKDKNIQIKITVYDDQGLASSKTTPYFPIHSNYLKISNIQFDKNEYFIGDDLYLYYTIENDNPVEYIKITLKNSSGRFQKIYENYSKDGIKIKNPLKLKLPNSNYYAENNSYLEIELKDKYGNDVKFTTNYFNIKPQTSLPSPFNKLIELYANLNTDFPKDKIIVSKDSYNSIKGIKIDENNIVHVIISSVASYKEDKDVYSHRNIKYYYIKYYPKTNKIYTPILITKTIQYDKDKSGIKFEDFILFNNIPFILFKEYHSNTNNKFFMTHLDEENFTPLNTIINKNTVKWDEMKFFIFNNSLYVTWVDIELGNENRRNKFLKVYPFIGKEENFADFYLGSSVRIHNKYIYASCGKIYEIDENLKVKKLLFKTNENCTAEGIFKDYSNEKNIVEVIPVYNNYTMLSLIYEDFTTKDIKSYTQSNFVAVFDKMLIYDGYYNEENKIAKVDLASMKEVSFIIGKNASTSLNYKLVDINKNQYVVLATFGKTYITVADFSKDIIPPEVKFENTETTIENDKDIILKWTAKDNNDELEKLKLYKIIDGKETLLKQFTNIQQTEFIYHINENTNNIKFKIQAYDLNGNSSYDILALKIVNPVVFTSFNVNKTEINLGEKIIFSWSSNGDSQTKYTVYRKEIDSDNWIKLFEVKGTNKKVYKVTDFIGEYKFKIVSNDKEYICPNTVTIRGDLLKFNYNKFSPKSEFIKDGNIVNFKWEDNSKESLLYEIWLKTSNDTNFHKVGVTEEKNIEINFTQNIPFKWKIITNYKNKIVVSEEIYAKPVDLSSPKIIEVKPEIENDVLLVMIKFDKVKNAIKYRILKSQCNNIFSPIDTINETTYKDYYVETGKCYAYKIVAISDEEIQSKPSEEKQINIPINNSYNVIIENENNSFLKSNKMVLKYHPDKNVEYEKYEIRLGTEPDNLELYVITDNRSIIIDDLKYATTYYIEIYPLDIAGNRINLIPAKLTFTTGFDNRNITEKPKITISEISIEKIILKWEAISNVDYYEIYRKEDNKNFEFIGKTYNTYFIDNINLTYKKKYQYQVVAKNNNSIVKSDISQPVEIPISTINDEIICRYFDGYWYNEKCNEKPEQKCDAEHLNLCKNDSECEEVGGYWYNNKCNAQPEQICDKEHLNWCESESECEGAGGYWYNNMCNKEPEQVFENQIIIKKGWNLKALPVKMDNGISIKTFNKDGIITVWKWIGTKWQIYSPNDNVKELLAKYNITIISKLNTGEGFWINASKNVNVSVNGEDEYGIESLKINKGWNLLGIGKELISDEFDDFGEIKTIWKWTGSKWKVWSPIKKIMRILNDYGISPIEKIEKGEGFWINR